MRFFAPQHHVVFCLCLLVFLLVSSCAQEKPEKQFLPYVIQNSEGVHAISEADAQLLCDQSYCEKNQVYFSQFGRKRRSQPPLPVPIQEPVPVPSFSPNPIQPPEVLDYSRAMLNLHSAWSVTEGSSDVVVAVLDSGIELSHPDLQTNLDTSNAYDFYWDKSGTVDEVGHGTHVAGIVAAARNGIGVRGVAPRVKILPLKFLGPGGSGDTADAVRAIDYAVARGVQIISNSWGGGGYSELLNQAIQRAHARGIYFVAAAGNDGKNNDAIPTYPAQYTNVISVGSSDVQDQRSVFSNYGVNTVTLFASGSDIFSSYLGHSYKSLSGTSMATPQVSGAIALALSIAPDQSREELLTDLCESSRQHFRALSQCGRMDVGEFIRRVSTR